MSQISFETSDFANNPEPRCPCVLLLDISHSMSGQPIEELNNGLYFFKQALAEDSLALKRVELAIVTFGPTRLEMPFTSAANFMPAELCTRGDTPIGNAISLAIELVQQRKSSYKNNGIPYYRPWIFLITDGEPTDAWEKAAELVQEGEASKAFAFFAVGVGGANMEILSKISVREPIALDGLKFKELFTWLSTSLSSVSQSTPGTEVSLPSPKGWASV